MNVKQLREALETLPDNLEIITQYGPHYYFTNIDLKPGEYKKYDNSPGGWFQGPGKLNAVLISIAIKGQK